MGIIMVPITLGLAAILPGNHFLPFTDLPSLPYHMIGAVIGTRRNSFRALIVAVITLSLALWVATDMAPQITQMASSVGFAFEEGTTVSGLCAGFEWIGYLLHKLVSVAF